MRSGDPSIPKDSSEAKEMLELQDQIGETRREMNTVEQLIGSAKKEQKMGALTINGEKANAFSYFFVISIFIFCYSVGMLFVSLRRR